MTSTSIGDDILGVDDTDMRMSPTVVLIPWLF
jgi:hypothetical protein